MIAAELGVTAARGRLRARHPRRMVGRHRLHVALALGLIGVMALPSGIRIAASRIETTVQDHLARHRLVFAGPLSFDLEAQAPVAVRQPTDCQAPANPIVEENCRPGSDGWQVAEPSFTIVGYAMPTSVTVGEAVDLLVSTSAPDFDLDIYRSGYYAGKGGRLVMSIDSLRGGEQPACLDDPKIGLRSCTNWRTSYTLVVPRDWVSGIYLAVLTRRDDGRQSVVPFIVRDDERQAGILYQYDLSTYQAYNNYGGKSLYSFNSGHCPTVAEAPRAVEVSLARPHVVPPTDPTSYFRVEYPMVSWLEAQGYDVSYSTSLDTHRSGLDGQPNELLEHRVFLAVGHDEYWSTEMRSAMTQARDAGVHLAFFTGNTGYWKIRFEPDPWTGGADLVMVSYKTAESGPEDPSGDPTSLWRDPAGPNRPENELIGIMFNGGNASVFFPLRVTAELADDQVFRNTGLEDMLPGTYVDIGRQLVGWEWDAVADNGMSPEGLTVLATTPFYGELASDYAERYVVGTGFSNTTRYTAPSGAMVFAAGTIQWAWGLAIVEPDLRIQQITYNVLADMGVQPATPAEDLVLDGDLAPQAGAQAPADEIPLRAQAPPIIDSLTVDASAESALITWRTDRASRGQAWLVSERGETLTYLLGVGPAVAATGPEGLTHEIRFESLSADSDYHVVVIAATDDGGFAVSEVEEFRTPSASPVDTVRRAVGNGVRDLTCAAKPIARPAYYWVLNHRLLSGLLAAGALLGACVWLGARARRRRSPDQI